MTGIAGDLVTLTGNLTIVGTVDIGLAGSFAGDLAGDLADVTGDLFFFLDLSAIASYNN